MEIDVINLLLKKAEKNSSNHPLKAIEYAQKAWALAKEKNDLEVQVRALTIIIAEHYFAGKSIEGLKFVESNQDIIAALQAPTALYARLIKAISTLYFGNSQFDIALQYIQEAKKVFEQNQLFYDVAASLMVIGNIYRYQAEYSQAFVAFKKSLELYEKHQLPQKFARVGYTNLGSLFLQVEDPEQAMQYYEKALKHCTKEDIKDLTFCYTNLGLLYLSSDQYYKAIILLKKSVELNNNTYRYALSTSYYSLSGAFLGLKKIDQAQVWAEKAYELASEIAPNSTSYLLSLRYLLKCFNTKKEYHKVLSTSSIFLKKYQARQLDLKMSFTREIAQVLEQIMLAYQGIESYTEAYAIAKDLLDLRELSFQQSNNFKTLSIQAQYGIKEKEIELCYQKKLLEQQEKLNKGLQKNNKELDDFVNIAAHDLKAPIRNIHSFAKLLLHNNTDNQGVKGDIDFILKAAQRMESLIKSLLSYAKTGRANEKICPVDLNDILLIVKSNLRVQINDSNAEIKSQKLPIIKGNTNFMIQLFQNIIGNSLKYKRKHISANIHITVIGQENSNIIILSDNGIGIKEEHLKEIFNPFKRLHTKHEYEGSGIGLATCKRIVENHNGKIWVTSAIGNGSNFYLEFPHYNPIKNIEKIDLFKKKPFKTIIKDS